MDNYRIINDEKYRFKKISNINIDSLGQFYKSKYYETRNKKGKTSKYNKSEVFETEIIDDDLWRRHTWFLETKKIFEKHICSHSKSLLDIGCGYGVFLDFMAKEGWEVKGIEPSDIAYNSAKQKGLDVFHGTLNDYYNKNSNCKYSCVNLNNVLEHLVNPVGVLELCKKLLHDNGIIRIKVPNDFNKLQLIANRKVKNKNWWILYPDHINYFTFDSLENILRDLGFRIVHKTTDFPMEVFLLMGENYVDYPEIGKECHNKRKIFELSMTVEEREKLYAFLAGLGLGRNIILYGKLEK